MITLHIQETYGDRVYQIAPDHELYQNLFSVGEQLEHDPRAVFYPAYEKPAWQAQPLTAAQYRKLQDLCHRYQVDFDPTHYRTYSTESSFMPGYAEGQIGGPNQTGTIYVGVEPNGDSHS